MWILIITNKKGNINRACNSQNYNNIIKYIKKYYPDSSLTKITDYKYINAQYEFNIYMSNNLDKFGV